MGKDESIVGALFRIENVREINTLHESVRFLEERIPDSKASLKRALVTWIRYVIAPFKGLELDKPDLQTLTEVRQMLSTRIKQWEREIAEKGLKRGLEQGREKGLEEGRKDILRKMLVLKFGSLPDWAESQIAHADAALLDQWVENLLDGHSGSGLKIPALGLSCRSTGLSP